MQSKLFTVLFLAVSNALLLSAIEFTFANPNNSQFIYGKVTTIDDEVYEGQIRWGDEEAFWFDYFNSSKPENENLKWLSKSEVRALNEKDSEVNRGYWGKIVGGKWNSYHDDNHTHVFSCQFGDIKAIHLKSKNKVKVEFKNGEHYDLDGGSNDIGAKVQVNDSDLGLVKLDWNRVSMVEFMQGPYDLESKFGKPLYGIVKTFDSTFEGFLQWDHDERVSHDELNGYTSDGEMDIEFGNIKKIEKKNRGSHVTLMSGRSFDLKGTNDVNDDNRGIIVNIANFGRVDIPWDEFEEVEFVEVPSANINYDNFRSDIPLRGTVSTVDGDQVSGEMVYDLDEQFQLEVLNGMMDDIEYFIPFSNIKTIKPKNRKESLVILKNGEKLLLEDKVDVNESNDGVLFVNNDNTYIPWSEIEEITFE